MPLYEYRCEACGKVFEKIEKFSDAPLQVHEDCGGKVERLISAPAFHLKGTGWYVTDYAKGSGSVPAKGESHKDDSGKSDSGKGESGTSDSGKSESGKSDSSSKTSTDTATKTESKSESKPAPSNSSKND